MERFSSHLYLIENVFDEKPEVLFTTIRRGVGAEAELQSFAVNFDESNKTVNILAEAIVDNIFVAQSDAEIKNPTENTLKAAARGQLIAKLQVRRINLKTEEDEIILKEIINAGVNVPNSCGAGNCGSCMCSLLSGDVVLEENTVLDPSDEEDGWILACRSKPKSRFIEISFDE